jgi:hypothetical protein
MAIDAVFIDVVILGVDARNSFTLTGGVGQQRVATKTLITTCIDYEKLRFVRMVKSGPVAILAGDNAVQVLGADIHDVVVTLSAVFMHLLFARITILERLIFPDLLIGFVVIAVHEAVFAGSEIVRDVKRPEYQECGDNANDHE